MSSHTGRAAFRLRVRRSAAPPGWVRSAESAVVACGGMRPARRRARGAWRQRGGRGESEEGAVVADRVVEPETAVEIDGEGARGNSRRVLFAGHCKQSGIV